MSTPLGSFRVQAGADEVRAFRKATGLGVDDAGVPLTFPMRWLVMPDIRAALLRMVPEPTLVLVHESQSFAYHRSLQSNETYHLVLSAHREASPDRLFVDGTIAGADGTPCVTIETILRLFSTEAVAA